MKRQKGEMYYKLLSHVTEDEEVKASKPTSYQVAAILASVMEFFRKDLSEVVRKRKMEIFESIEKK